MKSSTMCPHVAQPPTSRSSASEGDFIAMLCQAVRLRFIFITEGVSDHFQKVVFDTS